MTRIWSKRMRDQLANRSREAVQRASHQTVRRAILSGQLVRQPCEVCGTTDRVHAHHDDYAKPLDVRWLCYLHHRRLHAELAKHRRALSDWLATEVAA